MKSLLKLFAFVLTHMFLWIYSLFNLLNITAYLFGLDMIKISNDIILTLFALFNFVGVWLTLLYVLFVFNFLFYDEDKEVVEDDEDDEDKFVDYKNSIPIPFLWISIVLKVKNMREHLYNSKVFINSLK